MVFRRILVPLDRSPESNVALPLARTIAEVTGGSIILVGVVDVVLPADLDRVTEAREWLSRVSAELSGGGLNVESYVSLGDVGEEIVQQIGVQQADLVVMRTHGRAGPVRATLGSVADRVLRRSTVPVLLLRNDARRVTAIRKLLVPVDGSPGGAVALGTAVGLARAAGAQLDLLEVVVPVSMQPAVQHEDMLYYDAAWHDDAMMAGARTYVEGLVSRLRATGLTASGQARMADDVPTGIAECARDADVVVMSTHALTGLPRAVLGSVADSVVRTSSCPVLLVHRSGPERTTPVPGDVSEITATAS